MARLVLVLTFLFAVFGPCASARAESHVFCWEFDRLGSVGADRLEGTSAPDHLALFSGDDHVLTFGGNDCVSGGAGSDEIHLGPGDDAGLGRGGHDVLVGGAGADTLFGGLGADRLDGEEGDDVLADEPDDRAADVLVGGDGNDELRAGLGFDTLLGGAGDDVLRAGNGAIDHVDCGDGFDRAFADRGDLVVGCERPVFGYRPAVRRSPVAGGRRTVFRLSWDGGAAAVEPAGYAPARPGCARGSWRIRSGTGSATLRWTGRRPPCPGRYLWRVVHVDPMTMVDCEAPATLDCRRRETVGEVSFLVG